MAILKDVIEIIRDGKGELLSLAKKLPNNISTTLAKESRKGVLQFPIICSESLSLENAMTISKAMERQCVSYVRIFTSINNITDEKTVYDYLSTFHKNTDTGKVDADSILGKLGESSKSIKKTTDMCILSYDKINNIKSFDRNIYGLLNQNLLEEYEFVDELELDKEIVSFTEIEEDSKEPVLYNVNISIITNEPNLQ